jgi:succinate dehydrogenase / fumarate reductase cytochrome b subunit
MNGRLTRYLKSSIGKKQIMAVTGLLLIGFLLGHLGGNLLLLCGGDTFNKYAHLLITNPLLPIAEGGLVVLFLAHLGLAIRTIIENKKARPVPYYYKKVTGRGSNLASASMPYTGIILLIFVISHLIHFKYGPHYDVVVNGVEMRDIYKVVIDYFQNKIWVLWYVFAMTCTGFHVAHGFQSAFQSLGFNHPNYNGTIKKISIGLGIIIASGFSLLAIYSHLKGA